MPTSRDPISTKSLMYSSWPILSIRFEFHSSETYSCETQGGIVLSFRIWSVIFLPKKDPEGGSTLRQRLYLDNQHWSELNSQAFIKSNFLIIFLKQGCPTHGPRAACGPALQWMQPDTKFKIFLKQRFLCTYLLENLSDTNNLIWYIFFLK